MGAKVIMVVDSGSVAFDPIKAVSGNVDVLVFDHHDTQDIMPKAHAIVNPKRKVHLVHIIKIWQQWG